MVNNYPEYAAGISYQKAEEGEKHFYNAQVKVDPSDDSMSAVLTKDGTVISELPDGGGGESDLSTAKVTFSSSLTPTPQQYCIALLEMMGTKGMVSEFTIGSEPETVDVILYEGSQIIYAPDDVNNIAVTGDITEEEGEIIISGAGTISYGTK